MKNRKLKIFPKRSQFFPYLTRESRRKYGIKKRKKERRNTKYKSFSIVDWCGVRKEIREILGGEARENKTNRKSVVGRGERKARHCAWEIDSFHL